MVRKPAPNTRLVVRFAEPLWPTQSAPWRPIEAHLSQEHLARELQQAMPHLDLPALYSSSAGRGKAPHRPDLLRAIVLFAWRRGQRQPRPWLRDTQEHCALGWLGFGLQPSRRWWYECRDRVGASLDPCNEPVWPQAVAAEVSGVTRGALEGSAVAANAARRRWRQAARLPQRRDPRTAARHAAAPGHTPDDVPGGLANTSPTRTAPYPRANQAQEQRARLQAAHHRRSPSERRPLDKSVGSPGAPAAALGVDQDHVFRPLSTSQTLPDVEAPLLLSYAVFAPATAAGTFPPLLARPQPLPGRR